LKATGITKDEQQRALLLHVAGEEVHDIIETLDNTGTKYDQAVAALLYLLLNLHLYPFSMRVLLKVHTF
jgi:hypothetical protein